VRIDLVDPDGLGRGRAGASNLLAQVLFLETFHCLPIEAQSSARALIADDWQRRPT
jgi:hypothetical protein